MINTERLILRPFSSSDAEDVFEYINAQTINCFADMKLDTLDDAKNEVVRRKEEEAEYYFAICLKESGKVIGEIFSHPEAANPNEVNLDTHSPCWMLNPDYQGKGYACEAAFAFYNYLFNEKNARRIYTYTEDYNFACQKLCEKLGMRKEGLFKQFVSFVNNPDGSPLYENTLQYAILKDEWQLNTSEKSKMQIVLKQTKAEEIELLKKIEEKSFDVNSKYFKDGVLPPLSEEEKQYSLEALFDKPGYTTLTIWYDDTIVGCIVVKDINEATKEIVLFFISTDYQGKHLGQKALEMVENSYPKVHKWRLVTPTQVIRNAVFYVNKCGYSIVKVEELDNRNENGMFVFEKNK